MGAFARLAGFGGNGQYHAGQTVAGAWRSIDGGPLQRDVVTGDGEPRTNDPLSAVTLAVVYPAVVYVRAGYGDKWHSVVSKDEADAFLRAFGWELEAN